MQGQIQVQIRQVGRSRSVFGRTALAALLGVLLLVLGFTFTLEAGSVTYSARDARGSWQGTAPLTSLTLTPEAGGLRVSAVLEPGGFSSGNFIRDGNARFTVFEVGRYPTATLTGTLPLDDALTGPEPRSRTQTAPFTGELTLHGVTRSLTFPVTVTRAGAQVSAEGTFAVLLSDFNMTRPSLFGVVVDDRVEVSASLTGTLVP